MSANPLFLKGRHPVFEPPADPQAKIWRYMDFTQFINMLEEKGLLFTRADLLVDKFEGTMSRPLYDFLKKRSQWDAQTNVDLLRLNKGWVFVNCWHMNEDESAAMWKIYSTSKESVCVRTTYARLREALAEDVYIGTVKYISYDRDEIPADHPFWPLVHKRKSFEHERELRAVWSDIASMDCIGPPNDVYPEDYHPAHEEWVWKQADLAALFDRVYVSPTAGPWFLALVKKTVRTYGLSLEVQPSDLAAEPLLY